MATVDKNFKVKHGLIVEGTTATVNGENIATTNYVDSAISGIILDTDHVTEGSNLYFTAERAQNAVSSEIGTMIGTALGALTTDDISEGTTNLYFTAQRAVDAGDGVFDGYGSASSALTSANTYTDTALNSYTPTSGLDAAISGYGYITSAALSGYATESYADGVGTSSNTSDTVVRRDGNGDIVVTAVSLDNRGNVAIDGFSNVTIDAQNAIVINPGTATNEKAYIGSVSSVNEIATHDYVDTAIGNLPAGYITSVDTNVFNVDSGTLQLNSVVSAPGTEVHISKLELHLPDDTNLGAIVAHPYDGSLTVAAINQLTLESHSGDVNIDPQSGNVYISGNITTTGTNNITASNNLYAGSGAIIGGADYGNDGFLQVKDANGTTNISLGASVAGASLEIHGSQTFYASINDGGTQYGNISYDGGKNLVINGNYNDVILQSDSGYAYIGNNNSPATRIATQAYVDATSQGLNVKQSVKAAANSYADLGVLVDGVTLVTGDRVLAIANDQNDGGIYVATVVDGVATFVRSDDQQTPTVGDFVFVESGYTHHAQGWILSTVLNGYQVWTQFSAAGEYTAGTGITLDGNAISVTANTYDTYGAASTAETNANTYTDTAVSGKQNTLSAGNGIDISGDTVSAKYNHWAGAIGVDGSGNLEVKVDDTSIWTGGSANQLMVKTGVGSPVASKTYATDAAATAESNAKSYADTNFVNVADLPGQLSDYVLNSEKGQASGVATLDSTGNVPVGQLGNVPANYITSVTGPNLSVSDSTLYFDSATTMQPISLWVNHSADINGLKTDVGSVALGEAVSIYTVNNISFEAGKAVVKISANGKGVQISELSIAHDGSNVYSTEYGSISTDTDIASLDVVKNESGTIHIIATALDNCTIFKAKVLMTEFDY